MTAAVNTEHWAVPYIGRPWRRGAQGPEEFDCWSFVRWVERERFGRDLAEIIVPEPPPGASRVGAYARAFAAHPEEWAKWRPTSTPAEGDAVAMSKGREIHHVGLWIDADRGGILHCLDEIGVILSPVAALRAALWRRIDYYAWA